MVRVDRRVGGLAGVVTLLILVARLGSNWIASWEETGEFPAWAPTFGTFGETMVLYDIGTEIIEPLVLILLAVGLGRQVGRRLDVAREYRRLVGAVAAGSTLVVAAWTILTWYAGPPVSDGFDIVLVLGSLASAFVSTTLPITVGVLAGAALAYFERDATPPTQPSTANRGTAASEDHEL